MVRDYSEFVGHPVIVMVTTSNLRVPLRGILVSETEDSIELRIAGTWNSTIYKRMIVDINFEYKLTLKEKH